MHNLKSPFVIWVTGLAGSGKTTLANLLYENLKNTFNIVKLDGDDLRAVFNDEVNYDESSRKKIAFRNARLSKFLSDQNVNIIIPTISLFHDVQKWSRENIANYIEIFVDTPMKILLERDQKNLYSKALKGEITDVVGVDITPQFPIQPDYVFKPENNINQFVNNFIKENLNEHCN